MHARIPDTRGDGATPVASHAAVIHLVGEGWEGNQLLQGSELRTQVHATEAEFRAADDPGATGCVILDLERLDGAGLEVLERLGQSGPGARPVIALAGAGDVPTAVAAMKRGAFALLEKPLRAEALLAAVHEAVAADQVQRGARQRRHELSAAVGRLSPRERQILRLLLSGRANKEIAGELGVDGRTISWHRRNLLGKLGARSLVELARELERLRWEA